MKRSTILACLTLAVLLTATAAAAQTNDAKKEGEQASAATPPVYHVLFHTPGPEWKSGVSFRDQPGIEEHVRYMAELLDRGLMVMGGPFLDDSGGMMVSRIPTIEEAQRIANEDPAVQRGLLRVEVRAWYVPMASVK